MTLTSFFYPILYTLSIAYCSIASFHLIIIKINQGSMSKILLATVKFKPYPPAFKLINNEVVYRS